MSGGIDRWSALESDVRVILDETLGPKAQAEALRDASLLALKEGQDQNFAALGYVPGHDTFVDGTQVPTLTDVQASSMVVFEFHLLGEVVQWVDDMLILHSPTRSGRFARSHQWFADDVPFDDVANPPQAESYVVLNTQPYARKIERGLSSQAPDGVFHAVATLGARRFGRMCHISYTMRSYPGGAIGEWARSASAQALARDSRGGRASGHGDWLTRQPAIYIDPGR